MLIIVAGNVVDGFTHYGPFVDSGIAIEWGDHELQNVGSEWVVVELERPNACDFVHRAARAAENILETWGEAYADEDEPISGADMVEYMGNIVAGLA